MSEYRPPNSRLTRYAAPGRSHGPKREVLKYVLQTEDVEVSVLKENTLKELIVIADHFFSLVLRYRYIDDFGTVRCFTCGRVFMLAEIQCGHYMDRDNMSVRWSFKNCRPQCEKCNEHNDGERDKFAEALEIETPGITEILERQAREPLHVSRRYVAMLIVAFKEEYQQHL